jgi:4-hydroxybenzoate polyprenyltransferase
VSGLVQRVRVFLLLARPPLLLLLAMSGALGAASAGAALEVAPAIRALLVMVPFVVYAVSLNDLADVEVDRVNLAGVPSRPLVSARATARDVRVVAAVALLLALVVAWSVGPVSLAVTALGLAVATAYSVPPFALSRRGVVAPLVLPLCFLAVPFVVGVDAAGGGWGIDQAALLGALYAGFVGRLLVKDFRDVRGDALLGKRTFLVRHGRAATCALSGVLWVGGSFALLVVPAVSLALALCWFAVTGVAVGILVLLARSSAPRRDEALVSGLAICGRTLVLLLLLHFALVAQGASTARSAILLGATTLLLLLSAVDMSAHGPRARLTLTAAQRTAGTRAPSA